MLNFILGVLVMSVFAYFAVEAFNREQLGLAFFFAGPVMWVLVLASLVYKHVIKNLKYLGCKSLIVNRKTGGKFFIPHKYYSKIISVENYWCADVDAMMKASKPLIKKSLLLYNGEINTRYLPKAIWHCSTYPILSKKETKKLIKTLDKDSQM